MAQYWTDFSEYAAGAEPSDWTKRWHGADGAQTWNVIDTPPAGSIGGKAIEHNSNGESNRSFLSWDDIDADANRDNIEILCKMQSSASDSHVLRLFARASGTDTTENGYVSSTYLSSNLAYLSAYVNGTGQSPDQAAKTINIDTWYWVRLRINGTTTQLRIWEDGTSEPGTWDINTTRTDVSGVGWAGLGGGGLGIQYFDWFSVGTNGDTAPGIIVRSIQAGGGGDYTTISAWEAAAPALGSDIWKGEIDDNSEYNENVIIAPTGSPSTTSYMWLTGGANNRHAGVAGTGHPRIRGSTNGSHVIQINPDSTDWTRIEWLEIQQDSTGSSDEGIRVGGTTGSGNIANVLISHCIIWASNDIDSQDGVYMGNWDGSYSIDNCIVYNFNRAALNLQQFGTGNARTQTVNVDHCTLVTYTTVVSGETEDSAIFIRSQNAGDVMTVNVYNTIGYLELNTFQAFADGPDTGLSGRVAPVGSVTWNGSHNLRGDQSAEDEIDGTNNLTNSQFATSGDSATSQSSGSWVVFENITAGSEDFRLLDAEAGNLAARNGTNRQGSEPDSRQDFSVTVTGETRPTTGVDIGADQFISAVTLTKKYPASDIKAAGWDSFPTNSQSLFAQIDETVRSDTDYIKQNA